MTKGNILSSFDRILKSLFAAAMAISLAYASDSVPAPTFLEPDTRSAETENPPRLIHQGKVQAGGSVEIPSPLEYVTGGFALQYRLKYVSKRLVNPYLGIELIYFKMKGGGGDVQITDRYLYPSFLTGISLGKRLASPHFEAAVGPGINLIPLQVDFALPRFSIGLDIGDQTFLCFSIDVDVYGWFLGGAIGFTLSI